MIPYKPFSGIRGFYLERSQAGDPEFLVYKKSFKPQMRLRIRSNGYMPKTGVYLCTRMKPLVKNRNVLDIGTGEIALLALYAIKHGAKSAIGCDIDDEIINWARQNVLLNKIENVKIIKSDLFEEIKGRFDLIVSNAPQMPMVKRSLHDSGGRDGRKLIEKIISQAPNYLNSGGELLLLIFDFLGVDESFNSQKKPILDIFRAHGFEPSIIVKKKRYIRKMSQTEKSIGYIQKVFPGYEFKVDRNGRLFHYIFVVRGRLFSSTR